MEHNRIATGFQRMGLGWNDERIFQETRRIVIAELQNVVYNEWLPVVLGQSAMSEYDLGASTWTSYNSQVDPTIVNEFATASFRFGHTLVVGIFQMFNSLNQQTSSFALADEYFQSRQV